MSVRYKQRTMTTCNERLAVSIREAAEMLGVSPRTIQNYISAKRILVRKIGRRSVIPVRALESFLRVDQPSPGTSKGDAGAEGK